jgi:hypothetical protein
MPLPIVPAPMTASFSNALGSVMVGIPRRCWFGQDMLSEITNPIIVARKQRSHQEHKRESDFDHRHEHRRDREVRKHVDPGSHL